ncbi:MAG TPA: PAS domain-containing protein, partial [Myxococcota bacterium]|nr:PAS domain-containing protein [Myxococcota bacterium]
MSRSAVSAPTRPTSLVFLLASSRDVIEEVASSLAIADNPVEIHVLHDRGRLDAHLARVTPDIVILDRQSFSGAENLLTTGPLAGTPTLVLDDQVDTSAQQAVITAGARAYLPRSPQRGHALRDAINAANRRPALDRKLEETQRHFHSILEASSDGIMVLVDGRFQYVNSAFASALGYDAAELGEFGTLVAEGSRDAAHDALGRVAMSAGSRDIFETVLLAR